MYMSKNKKLSDLKKDQRNANKHSKTGMEMLKDGIIKNGLGRSILLSADDEIIAGNGVAESAELDGYLGSGTTMVASHQLGRVCFGMEIDPIYCHVIINRMAKLDPNIRILRNGVHYEVKQES